MAPNQWFLATPSSSHPFYQADLNSLYQDMRTYIENIYRRQWTSEQYPLQTEICAACEKKLKLEIDNQ